jgi:hypothetical protein
MIVAGLVAAACVPIVLPLVGATSTASLGSTSLVLAWSRWRRRHQRNGAGRSMLTKLRVA